MHPKILSYFHSISFGNNRFLRNKLISANEMMGIFGVNFLSLLNFIYKSLFFNRDSYRLSYVDRSIRDLLGWWTNMVEAWKWASAITIGTGSNCWPTNGTARCKSRLYEIIFRFRLIVSQFLFISGFRYIYIWSVLMNQQNNHPLKDYIVRFT